MASQFLSISTTNLKKNVDFSGIQTRIVGIGRQANCPLFHHHPTAQKSTFLKLSSEGDLNVDSFPLYGSFTFNGSFSRGLMNAGNLIRPVAVSTSVSSGKRDLARANEKNPSKLARIIQDWKEEIMRGKMTSWPFSHSHFYY